MLLLVALDRNCVKIVDRKLVENNLERLALRLKTLICAMN